MGKKKRIDGGADSVVGGDSRDIERAVRRMGLVDSRQPLGQWVAAVSRELPQESIDSFMNATGSAAVPSDYDVAYRDFDHARLLAGSWASASIRVQLGWLLPRLRAALASVDEGSRFLVEIGAGPGVHAAIVSAILKVPILAVDPHPSALGLPEQFAARTGGVVTSVTAAAEDLAAVLEERCPAAIYGLGVFRYFQPHNHETDAYSFRSLMDDCLKSREPEIASVDFFTTASAANVLLIESGCPDYLAEVLVGARRAGFDLAREGASVLSCSTAGLDHKEMLAMHFTPEPQNATKVHPLVEMYLPLPEPAAGLQLDGPAAEAFRVSNDPSATTVSAYEINYPDGSLRSEIFSLNSGLCGIYQSGTNGYRSVELRPEVSLSTLKQDFDFELTQARTESGLSTRTLLGSAMHW